MPNYNFAKDWGIARTTEREVARWLERNRKMTLLEECNTNEYDIRMRTPSGISVKIEVKEDFTCRKTGNVGLEFECRGKPSGIAVSQADMYIYKIHRPDGLVALYAVPVDKLVEMVENTLYHRIVVGETPALTVKIICSSLRKWRNTLRCLVTLNKEIEYECYHQVLRSPASSSVCVPCPRTV